MAKPWLQIKGLAERKNLVLVWKFHSLAMTLPAHWYFMPQGKTNSKN